MEAGNQSVNNMNREVSTCPDCGMLFANPQYLKNHILKGCSQNKEESDHEMADAEESSEDEDDAGFLSIITRAREELDGKYQEKLEELMGEGQKEKTAEKAADEFVKSKMIKSMMKKHTALLTIYDSIKNSPTHRSVEDSIRIYMEGGRSFKKAMKIAVKEHEEEYETMLEMTDSEDEDTEEESAEED